jgi:hypothetical protein
MAIIMSVLLNACTVIEISSTNDSTVIERSFGFASIKLGAEDKATLARATSFGAMSSPNGFQLGYTAQSFAMMPYECQMVLWVEHPEQVNTVRELVGDIENVCVINEKGGVNE